MDWSNKASSHLDWDNLALLDAKVSGIPNHPLLQQQDFGAENGSVYSWNGAGFSASDLGTGPSGCSSKSSFSTTMDSSSRLRTRISEINFETGEVLPRELDKGTEFNRLEDSGASPEAAPSVISGEQLIGLKLGKRTYFEDICAGSHAKTSQLSITPSQPANTIKKSRVSHQKVQSDRCQVEGCNVDLTSAKDYHRKHRVCESHSKCQKVVVAGLERRFCQQCSRFHDLLEFDQKKRSCRRRLSDHNARRRKPPPETFSLSTASLSSSFYDDRQPMNLLFNRISFGHPRVTETSASWEDHGFKMSQAKDSYVRSSKAGSVGGETQLLTNKLPTIVSSVYHNADRLMPFKNTGVEVINQGLQASMDASHLDGAPDLRRALSLLSTESWVSPNPGLSTSFDQVMHVNHTAAALPAINMSHASSETWPVEAAEQLLAHESRVPPCTLDINGNHFQEIQLLKPQYGSAFFNSNQTH